jgi:hypothetical protein
MANDNQVFNFMNNVDPVVDYTGANAEYYLQEYVNRPEDEGNLEGFQNALSDMGVAAPPADMLNTAIYLAQQDEKGERLSAGAIIPFLGEIRAGYKSVMSVFKKNDKFIDLYRGVKDVGDVDALVEGKNVVGRWTETAKKNYELMGVGKEVSGGRKIFDRFAYSSGYGMGTVPKRTKIHNLLFTTDNKAWAFNDYAMGGNRGGKLLHFKVPLSYVEKHGRSAFGNRWKKVGGYLSDESKSIRSELPTTVFTDGLPKKFLVNVEDLSKLSGNEIMTY